VCVGCDAQVKETARAYRVYFSKTQDSPDDYLVDHSIIMYLIDPAGDFVTFYGKNFTAEQLASSIWEKVVAWNASHPEPLPASP
jgi:protein SCO1